MIKITDIKDLGDIKVKFDVVVMNPPYKSGLWKEFFYNSLILSNRFIVMISPDNTTDFSPKSEQFVKKLRESGIQSIEECTKYFSKINSGRIVVYFIDKSSSSVDCLDNRGIEYEIVKKIINKKNEKLECFLSSNQSADFIKLERFDSYADGRTLLLQTVSKSSGAVFKYINNSKAKIITGKNYWFVNQFFASTPAVVEDNRDFIISSNIMAIKKIPGVTIDDFQRIYTHKLFRFVLTYLKRGKFATSPHHISLLPMLDYTKNWLDDEIFKEFNLTQEEIDYILEATK